MHWHPPQNSTKSKQGADLPTYTVVPNGLNPSKISSLTHAILQNFPKQVSVESHNFRFRSLHSFVLVKICQTLAGISMINGQFRNLSFVWVFFIHWAQLCLPTVCCKEFKYTPASLANAPCLHYELWPSLSSPERTFRAQGMCKVRHAEDSTSNQFLNLKETAEAWRHQSIQQHPPLTA